MDITANSYINAPQGHNYYRTTDSNRVYSIFKSSETVFIAFYHYNVYYFDGLWETEAREKKIGYFDTQEQAKEEILKFDTELDSQKEEIPF